MKQAMYTRNELKQMADEILKPKKKRDSRPLVNGRRRRLSKKRLIHKIK
jgi:hypothetical protein